MCFILLPHPACGLCQGHPNEGLSQPGQIPSLWAGLMDGRVVLMCQSFVIPFSTHNCAVLAPAGILSDGRGSGLCGFLPSQNTKCHFRSPFFACCEFQLGSGCSQPGCLSLLSASTLSQAAQALSPFESEHKVLSAALLSSFFAHYSLLPALQPVASLPGHPQSVSHPSGVQKPVGVSSLACSQVDKENMSCVTLCVPAWLC